MSLIAAATYDEEDNMVYMLCNKKAELIGFFLLKFNASMPSRY